MGDPTDETKALFFDDKDEGIFADDEAPVGAYGDPDAEQDLRDEGFVPGLQFGMGPDGIPLPVEMTLPPPGSAAVVWPRFLCLAGPCRHYIECLQQFQTDGPERRTRRFCRRLRTWAELMDLANADVWACSAYDPQVLPAVGSSADFAAQAVVLNRSRLLEVAERAEANGLFRGRCLDGPCEHVVELLLTYPATGTDQLKRVIRYCPLLAGAARQYEVHERPMYACSAWSPLTRTPAVALAAVENRELLEERRLLMSQSAMPTSDLPHPSGAAEGPSPNEGEGTPETALGGEEEHAEPDRDDDEPG